MDWFRLCPCAVTVWFASSYLIRTHRLLEEVLPQFAAGFRSLLSCENNAALPLLHLVKLR